MKIAYGRGYFRPSWPPRLTIVLPVALIAAMINLQASDKAATRPYVKRTHTYKIVGNCALKADVYRSPDKIIRPVIFWIHGGALIIGYRGNVLEAQIERYVKAGFAVVSIDYRLAPETKLPQIFGDVQDAYSWVRAKGPKLFRIDPDRIAVVGHSAGGYLALTVGFQVRPRPRAIVSFYGYGDICGDWYSQPDPFYSRQPSVSKLDALKSVSGGFLCGTQPPERRRGFYLYCRQRGLWPNEVSGLDRHADAKSFDPFCPVRNVTGDFPPTLLIHGDNDTDVPFHQSVQMYEELQRHSVESELIRIAGGEHAFDYSGMNDPRIAAAFERVIAFLDKHIE